MHARVPGKSGATLEEEKRDGSGTPGSLPPLKYLRFKDCIEGTDLLLMLRVLGISMARQAMTSTNLGGKAEEASKRGGATGQEIGNDARACRDGLTDFLSRKFV